MIRIELTPERIKVELSERLDLESLTITRRAMRFRGPYALAASFFGAEAVEPTTKAILS